RGPDGHHVKIACLEAVSLNVGFQRDGDPSFPGGPCPEAWEPAHGPRACFEGRLDALLECIISRGVEPPGTGRGSPRRERMGTPAGRTPASGRLFSLPCRLSLLRCGRRAIRHEPPRRPARSG